MLCSLHAVHQWSYSPDKHSFAVVFQSCCDTFFLRQAAVMCDSGLQELIVLFSAKYHNLCIARVSPSAWIHMLHRPWMQAA